MTQTGDEARRHTVAILRSARISYFEDKYVILCGSWPLGVIHMEVLGGACSGSGPIRLLLALQEYANKGGAEIGTIG